MFGIDDLAIAGLIASLAGTALQTNAAARASRAANSATNQAIMNQNRRAVQNQQLAVDRAQDYEMDTRQKQQEAIKQELAENYTRDPLDATAIAQQASEVVGDTSGDYQRAKAESDARVREGINTFGRLMANVNSAGRLRQLENFANADAANQVGVNQALMQAQNRIDQYKIQQAANKGSGMAALGGLMNTAGSLMGTVGALGSLGSAAAGGMGAGSGIVGRGATLAADRAMRSPGVVQGLSFANWKPLV